MFRDNEAFPGIHHITDCMGVSFTLIRGKDGAILFDNGYGLEDVRQYIRTLTDRPVTVILSHAHHDHVLGSRWFDRVLIQEEDLAEYGMRTGDEQRRKVAEQAKGKGVPLPEDFFTAACPVPECLPLPEESFGFASRTFDLGGVTALCIHVPGHTPGSLMLYIPEYRLLLTGDNWNPCTWLWFPSSVPVQEWRKNMTAVCENLPFDTALCSHQPMIRSGEEVRNYIRSLTDERLEQAERVDMNPNIHTRQARPDGPESVFVFNWDKFMSSREGRL